MTLDEKIKLLEERVTKLENINKRRKIMTIVSSVFVLVMIIVVIVIYLYFIKNYITEISNLWK